MIHSLLSNLPLARKNSKNRNRRLSNDKVSRRDVYQETISELDVDYVNELLREQLIQKVFSFLPDNRSSSFGRNVEMLGMVFQRELDQVKGFVHSVKDFCKALFGKIATVSILKQLKDGAYYINLFNIADFIVNPMVRVGLETAIGKKLDVVFSVIDGVVALFRDFFDDSEQSFLDTYVFSVIPKNVISGHNGSESEITCPVAVISDTVDHDGEQTNPGVQRTFKNILPIYPAFQNNDSEVEPEQEEMENLDKRVLIASTGIKREECDTEITEFPYQNISHIVRSLKRKILNYKSDTYEEDKIANLLRSVSELKVFISIDISVIPQWLEKLQILCQMIEDIEREKLLLDDDITEMESLVSFSLQQVNEFRVSAVSA
eukprot:TRINITY_DN7111_c0_g1_i1.p1 TRINITY_DN7111_c0_g1~~TRINITY_DN7111_c0_g1_i1.p1  ORF type:complete len:376 (-),score=85.79 TRINITY_DN7111_c0_g1_i1:114-1241(-)